MFELENQVDDLFLRKIMNMRAPKYRSINRSDTGLQFKQLREQRRKTRYFSKLKRHGAMMEGYLKAVEVNLADRRVTVNYPSGTDSEGYDIGLRARSHQGAIGRPRGVKLRPFDLEGFRRIALNHFQRAISEANRKTNGR